MHMLAPRRWVQTSPGRPHLVTEDRAVAATDKEASHVAHPELLGCGEAETAEPGGDRQMNRVGLAVGIPAGVAQGPGRDRPARLLPRCAQRPHGLSIHRSTSSTSHAPSISPKRQPSKVHRNRQSRPAVVRRRGGDRVESRDRRQLFRQLPHARSMLVNAVRHQAAEPQRIGSLDNIAPSRHRAPAAASLKQSRQRCKAGRPDAEAAWRASC